MLKIFCCVLFFGAIAMAQEDCEAYVQKVTALGTNDAKAILEVVKPNEKYMERSASLMARYENNVNGISENDLVEAYWKFKACGAALAEYGAIKSLVEMAKEKGDAFPEFDKIRNVVRTYVDLNTRPAGIILQVAAVVDLTERSFAARLFTPTPESTAATTSVQNQLQEYKKGLSKTLAFKMPRSEVEFRKLPLNQRKAMLDQFKNELEVTRKIRLQLRQSYEKTMLFPS